MWMAGDAEEGGKMRCGARRRCKRKGHNVGRQRTRRERRVEGRDAARVKKGRKQCDVRKQRGQCEGSWRG